MQPVGWLPDPQGDQHEVHVSGVPQSPGHLGPVQRGRQEARRSCPQNTLCEYRSHFVLQACLGLQKKKDVILCSQYDGCDRKSVAKS